MGGGADEGEGRGRRIERAAGPCRADIDAETSIAGYRTSTGRGRHEFVDEQHIAVLELENRRQITCSFEGRPDDLEIGAHLGDDVGGVERLETGRTGEEQMVGGFTTTSRGTEHDPQMPFSSDWPTNSDRVLAAVRFVEQQAGILGLIVR